MNGYLRQSTASQSRLIGPFIDDADFKTPEIALTIANTDVKLRANGTTLANKNSGGATHQVNGMYSLVFDATDTANVGELSFSVIVAGALPVFGTYVVLEEAVYDAMFAASALGYIADQPVNATKIGGTTQTGRDIGASVLLSPGTGAGEVDLSSGKVLLQATQTGVTIPTVTTLTNAPGDSAGVTTLLSRLSALRAGYLDNLSAGAAALESSLQSLITTIGAAGAGLTATASAVWSVATRLLTAGTNIVLAKGTGVTGFNDLSAAEVNAEVDTALADYDGPTHSELTTALGTADDAILSAIGGLNNLSQSDVRSAVGLASANLDTQLSTISSFIDTEVGAIKAKTDNLPDDPAATSDILTPSATISALRAALTPFPSTPILDDANRADEGPPPSSKWTTGVGFNGELLTTGHRVLSNQFARQAGGIPECESYWNDQAFDANSEAYLTATSTGFTQIRFGLRLNNIGEGTLDGYFAYVHNGDNYQIDRVENGVPTTLIDLVSLPMIVAGNKYGFRAIGPILQLWVDLGSGWTVVLEVSDSTFKDGGYVGVYTESTSIATFNDFGGGNCVLPVHAIVNAVWDEDIVSAHQTEDTAGRKLSQALILYEGN